MAISAFMLIWATTWLMTWLSMIPVVLLIAPLVRRVTDFIVPREDCTGAGRPIPCIGNGQRKTSRAWHKCSGPGHIQSR
ncbi:hypothetical protein SAMN03159511_2417 [Pseudomonas sp. NFACC19-2]|nr:hypothetical protein SAMN03159511_2417 [Pseudomonas sp. NFACC19-2]